MVHRIRPATLHGVEWLRAAGSKHPTLMATGITMAGILLRLATQPLVAPLQDPFVTEWCVVLMVGLLCGLWRGFVSVLIFAFIGWYGYLEAAIDEASILNVAVFILTSFFAIWVVTTLAHINEHQTLLAREFRHRNGNLISVIQAIISKTIQDPDTCEALYQRLGALAAADALTFRGGNRAEVVTIIRDAVVAFAGANITLDIEPGLWVETRTAAYLRLLLHEWATNSTKYGALRPCQRDHARVQIRLRQDRLEWLETAVTNIRPISHNGFGTTLARQLARALDGKTESHLRADGIYCSLFFSPAYLIRVP